MANIEIIPDNPIPAAELALLMLKVKTALSRKPGNLIAAGLFLAMAQGDDPLTILNAIQDLVHDNPATALDVLGSEVVTYVNGLPSTLSEFQKTYLDRKAEVLASGRIHYSKQNYATSPPATGITSLNPGIF